MGGSPGHHSPTGDGSSDETWNLMLAGLITAFAGADPRGEHAVMQDVLDGIAERRLPSRCPGCQRRVRVLWSGPIGPSSRPVFLTCRSTPPCDWRVPIPASAVQLSGGGRS